MVVMDDGEEMEYGPGDFGVMGPGHDAWIVGDEPCVVHIKVTGTIEYLDDSGQVTESANADTQRAVYLAWCREHDVHPSERILG